MTRKNDQIARYTANAAKDVLDMLERRYTPVGGTMMEVETVVQAVKIKARRLNVCLNYAKKADDRVMVNVWTRVIANVAKLSSKRAVAALAGQ